MWARSSGHLPSTALGWLAARGQWRGLLLLGRKPWAVGAPGASWHNREAFNTSPFLSLSAEGTMKSAVQCSQQSLNDKWWWRFHSPLILKSWGRLPLSRWTSTYQEYFKSKETQGQLAVNSKLHWIDTCWIYRFCLAQHRLHGAVKDLTPRHGLITADFLSGRIWQPSHFHVLCRDISNLKQKRAHSCPCKNSIFTILRKYKFKKLFF